MQDKPFVTEPRKGLLSIGQYHLLMSWAYNCSWHVLPSFGKTIDEWLLHVLDLTIAWKAGKATVDMTREASVRELILMGRRIKNISYNDYQEII